MPYFDHNATTPLASEARSAWLEASRETWCNPSSSYRRAAQTALRLESAREQIAEVIGCPAENLVFCSGATEANNALFRHWAQVHPEGTVCISTIEHPSVRLAAHHYFPDRVHTLPVNAQGQVCLESLESLLDAVRPVLCSVMAAHNESGVLQPWQTIAERCRERGIPYHCDAAQWVGKLPASGLGGCDAVSLSGHKFGAPPGVGLLKISEDFHSIQILRGGGQENNHRSGTQNLAGIQALASALLAREDWLVDSVSSRAHLRDQFEETLRAQLPGIEILGSAAPRLWNTSLLRMPAHANLRWVSALDKRGFEVATGSACSSGKTSASPALESLGVPAHQQNQVLRISAGPDTQAADWIALAAALIEVAEELENFSEKQLEKTTVIVP